MEIHGRAIPSTHRGFTRMVQRAQSRETRGVPCIVDAAQRLENGVGTDLFKVCYEKMDWAGEQYLGSDIKSLGDGILRGGISQDPNVISVLNWKLGAGETTKANQDLDLIKRIPGDKIATKFVLILTQLAVFFEQSTTPIIIEEIATHFSGDGTPALVLGDPSRTFPVLNALNEKGRNSLRRVLLECTQQNVFDGYYQAMKLFGELLHVMMLEEEDFEILVAGISDPWFLSIFVKMLPWEILLQVCGCCSSHS